SEAIIVREAYVWRPRLVLLRNLRGPRILEAILDTLVGFLKTTTADVENDRRRVTQGVPQRRTKACDHEGCLVEHDLLDSASNSESSGLVVRCSLAEVAERDVQFRIGLESRNRHPHRVSCTRDKRNHRSRVFLLDGPILVRCRYQGLWLNGAPGCLYGCDFAACGHDGFPSENGVHLVVYQRCVVPVLIDWRRVALVNDDEHPIIGIGQRRLLFVCHATILTRTIMRPNSPVVTEMTLNLVPAASSISFSDG